nr:hypothetical protein Iba_chr12fCG13970 [Ipomoea batatas]
MDWVSTDLADGTVRLVGGTARRLMQFKWNEDAYTKYRSIRAGRPFENGLGVVVSTDLADGTVCLVGGIAGRLLALLPCPSCSSAAITSSFSVLGVSVAFFAGISMLLWVFIVTFLELPGTFLGAFPVAFLPRLAPSNSGRMVVVAGTSYTVVSPLLFFFISAIPYGFPVLVELFSWLKWSTDCPSNAACIRLRSNNSNSHIASPTLRYGFTCFSTFTISTNA